MKTFQAILLWLAVAVTTFATVAIANSLGAMAYEDPFSYGSSALQQAISHSGKFLLHALPGIAIGASSHPRSWQLASAMSSISVAAFWWYFRGTFGTLLLGVPVVEATCLVVIGGVAAKLTSRCLNGRRVKPT